jgi:hypothetical protein
MFWEQQGSATMRDGEIGAVERPVLALHQAILELAFVHTLNQVERARTELHGVVGETTATVRVGRGDQKGRGGNGQRHGKGSGMFH